MPSEMFLIEEHYFVLQDAIPFLIRVNQDAVAFGGVKSAARAVFATRYEPPESQNP
jgi:hypothetical protein